MSNTPIPLAPTRDFKESFFNEATFRALEYAFKSPDYPIDRSPDNEEYQLLARAYGYLSPHFASWREESRVVPARAKDAVTV